MPDSAPISSTLGQLLLQLARDAIATKFGHPAQSFASMAELQMPGASFVTLKQHGALRGCIGSLQAWRPLQEDVCDNARKAAFADPRFPPLTNAELANTRIEVSLLTAPTPLQFSSEAEALGLLHPGKDGIILSDGFHRATFLPQVWEELPTPQGFIAHLKQKAGLPADYWSPSLQLERYQVQKWQEAEQ